MRIVFRLFRDRGVLEWRKFVFYVERLLREARALVDVSEIEIVVAGVANLIVFVIKYIEFNGGLFVGLFRKISASMVCFLCLLAIGLLKCVATFERVVGVIVR